MSLFNRSLAYARTGLAVGLTSVAIGEYTSQNHSEHKIECARMASAQAIKACDSTIKNEQGGDFLEGMGGVFILGGVAFGIIGFFAPDEIEELEEKKELEKRFEGKA